MGFRLLLRSWEGRTLVKSSPHWGHFKDCASVTCPPIQQGDLDGPLRAAPGHVLRTADSFRVLRIQPTVQGVAHRMKQVSQVYQDKTKPRTRL